MNFNRISGPIKMVFLGCGAITGSHAKTLKHFENVHLYFASRRAEKAAAFAQKHGGYGHFESYETAIASPEPNVVFIATPPDSHLQLAVAALQAGKHVIVEKPPFFSSTDFDIVDALRRQHGLQLFVAETFFYKPLLKTLRTLLASGSIGQIKFLVFNIMNAHRVTGWRNDAGITGGGALFEGGIHWINLMANLGLTIKSVTGFQPGGRNTNQFMERSIQVVAVYEEGPVATLFYSWEVNSFLRGRRLSKIYGTDGVITFESNGFFVFVRSNKWRIIFPGRKNEGGAELMFADFFKALRNGNEAQFTLEQARRDVEVIEEVYRSAAIL
jgi:predicted dehydrogenase